MWFYIVGAWEGGGMVEVNRGLVEHCGVLEK